MIHKSDRGEYKSIYLEYRDGHLFGVHLTGQFTLYAKEFYGDWTNAQNICKSVDPRGCLPSIDQYRLIIENSDEINRLLSSAGGDLFNMSGNYMTCRPSDKYGRIQSYSAKYGVPPIYEEHTSLNYRIIVPE